MNRTPKYLDILSSVSHNPTTSDTDGDGYWDGWIGVYGVGRTDNVVLYREHLESGDGIEGGEIVQEQVGVHDVSAAPSAMGADIDGDDVDEHSNVHVGERQWESDPTSRSERPETTLDVEVDYLAGRNPEQMTLSNGDSVLEATAKNYALYGIDVRFHMSDELNHQTLRKQCRADGRIYECLSPASVNAWEMNLVRKIYHNDTSRLHLFWANEYRTEVPQHLPHDWFVDAGTPGVAGHTGSEAMVTLIETNPLFTVPYGVGMFDETINSYGSNENKHRILMEEIGHTLGAGTADDKIQGIGECYSGGFCYGYGPYGSVTGGGVDTTPELVRPRGDPEWPVMGDADYFGHSRTAFSIEELQTVDFADVPSVND